ncbi:MAG: hypothetical protein ETSY1_34775 [Candidatus Entotheonella factor]|uniref:Uncharacterized protein n=1 Tax=Entotheonella factor TaxID=1429438 RepID=W4L988_ENTF1|nr:MAG: hypothetical protein ETSY1_34775 [Candidatus Entotheonella factor]
MYAWQVSLPPFELADDVEANLRRHIVCQRFGPPSIETLLYGIEV